MSAGGRAAALRLDAVVFVCGACVMVMELVGSRVLAPYFGTSLFVWTSLIGVILAALSAGYWLGGRLADRRPDPRGLAAAIAAAAGGVAAVSIAAEPVLLAVQERVPDVRAASVAATLVLFGFPSVCLGAVTPYAVRLRLEDVSRGGSTAGRLYALSTWGSIAGTFLAGFVLLARFGHSTILFLVAAALAACAASAVGGRAPKSLAFAVLALVAAFAAEPLAAAVRGPAFIDANTPYNRVWIYEGYDARAGRVRVMQINDEMSSKMALERGGPGDGYTSYYRLAAHFNPGLSSALMIGGAAYSYPKAFLAEHPSARMDVVEIDPGVTALARAHFGLRDDPRLRVFHEDARTFLNRDVGPYDAILGDAFRSYGIPFQLVTAEAVGRMHRALAPDGVLIVNVIASVEGRKGRFLRAFVATLERSFARVIVLATRDADDGAAAQNLIVVALKSGERPKYYSADPELDDYLHQVWIRDIPRDEPELTDDRAPVEDQVRPIIEEAARSQVRPYADAFRRLWRRGDGGG